MTEDDTLIEGAAGVYITLIELIGIEATIKIYETFRGQEVFFPKRFLRSDYIALKIMEKYDGTNLKELATEYGYTERHLRNLVKEYQNSKKDF